MQVLNLGWKRERVMHSESGNDDADDDDNDNYELV